MIPQVGDKDPCYCAAVSESSGSGDQAKPSRVKHDAHKRGKIMWRSKSKRIPTQGETVYRHPSPRPTNTDS